MYLGLFLMDEEARHNADHSIHLVPQIRVCGVKDALSHMTTYVHTNNDKVNFTLSTGHEGPDGKYRYSSALPLISAQYGGDQCQALAALPCSHCAEGWVVTRASLNGRGKSRLPSDSMPRQIRCALCATTTQDKR